MAANCRSLLSAILLVSALGAAVGDLTPPVQQLCDDYWNWRMQDMPEFATFVGFHDYDALLDDLTMSAWDNRYSTVQYFQARTKDLQKNATEHADIVNLEVLDAELQTFIDGFHFKSFYNQLNNLEGIQIDFLRLLTWMKNDTVDDYNLMITRLTRLPAHMDQIIQLLGDGMYDGIVQNIHSVDLVLDQVNLYLVNDSSQSPVYMVVFANINENENITKDDIAAIQESAEDTITEFVTPMFKRLYDFLSTEYIPNTRPDIAVTSLPNGTDLYNELILFHTGTTQSPEDIQQLGYQEVDRIELLMQEIVDELGYNMTVQQFSEMIKNDPSNYYKTEDELLDGFEYLVYNVTTPAVPLVFKNIPKAQIIVEADPMRTGAYYLSGSYDGSRPGVFYVGTNDVSSQAKYNMLTTSLHEGNPGHHLQGSYALESPDLPYFRSASEDRNYANSPSRFPLYTYYYEGWALYSENLGFDMDLYDDPLDRYGHYSQEEFRACRLVVDTGIHALGWTRQQAIDYVLAHTAMTRVEVEDEIDRYITWPGQALAYKVGQLQISALRSHAEDQLGDKFDIKDFHDVVLDSVGPMTIVQQEVQEWIDSVKQSNNL